MDDHDLGRRLGRAIQEHRRMVGLTQEELAERVGGSTEWISAVERGKGLPSLPLLFRVAEALGVAPSELLRVVDGAADRPALRELFAAAGRLTDHDLRVVVATANALSPGAQD